jgi:hypothetical protein
VHNTGYHKALSCARVSSFAQPQSKCLLLLSKEGKTKTSGSFFLFQPFYRKPAGAKAEVYYPANSPLNPLHRNKEVKIKNIQT